MAAKTKSKVKKKSSVRKPSARAKAAKPRAARAGAGGDEPSDTLRASAKAFAAKLLR
jgi:hypothetical protein